MTCIVSLLFLAREQVPNYSPHDVIENLKRRIKGEEYIEMQPWYKGFAGSIEVSDFPRILLYPSLFFLLIKLISREGGPSRSVGVPCLLSVVYPLYPWNTFRHN